MQRRKQSSSKITFHGRLIDGSINLIKSEKVLLNDIMQIYFEFHNNTRTEKAMNKNLQSLQPLSKAIKAYKLS